MHGGNEPVLQFPYVGLHFKFCGFRACKQCIGIFDTFIQVSPVVVNLTVITFKLALGVIRAVRSTGVFPASVRPFTAISEKKYSLRMQGSAEMKLDSNRNNVRHGLACLYQFSAHRSCCRYSPG